MASVEKTTGHVATEKVTSTQGNNTGDDTNAAINNEHNMSVRQSLRFWWKAIVFSFVISLCVVMEGYDTSLMNKFFAFQPFRNRFGDEVDADGNKLVSARWQTIILNGTQVRRFPLRFLTEGTLLTQKGWMHSRSHHQRLYH
jgi:SP family general alpha glucoside:H+ symporter-like MFS transporter